MCHAVGAPLSDLNYGQVRVRSHPLTMAKKSVLMEQEDTEGEVELTSWPSIFTNQLLPAVLETSPPPEPFYYRDAIIHVYMLEPFLEQNDSSEDSEDSEDPE